MEACGLKVLGNSKGTWPSGCWRRDWVDRTACIWVVGGRASVKVGNRLVVVRLRL